MDMLDKLIVNHIFSKNVFEIDLNQVKSGDTIFTFNEYEPIEVALCSDNYEVIIECLSYKIDGVLNVCEDSILKIESNLNYRISGEHEIDLGYIPSKYHIILKKENEIKNCYFEVLYNQAVSQDGMTNIVESLNNFIDGLSIDFFRKGPINNVRSTDRVSDYYIYELLEKYENKLIYNCNQISSNLKMTIKSDYIYNPIERKQNLKTIRNNLKKYNIDKYCNVVKHITYNTNENIILKKYLIKIIRIIKSCETDLDRILSQKRYNEQIINDEINIQHDKLLKANSSFVKKTSSNHIKSLNSRLEDERKWIKKLEIWKKSHDNSKNIINKLLYSEELEKVDINNQITHADSFYNNISYKFFMDLYKTLVFNNSNKRKFNSSELFADRKSYNIFEIYGFILIQNILKEIGFNLCEEYSNQLYNFGSNMHFTFSNDVNVVKVHYDHYCEEYYSAKDGEIVNINSRHCKPDYIITIFDLNGVFKEMIIVEMKYRRLRYMIDYQGKPTETDETISDYKQLKYCVSVENDKYFSPSSVLLIYPSIEEKIFTRFSGEYVGINVMKDFIESDAYNLLKSKIKKALQ